MLLLLLLSDSKLDVSDFWHRKCMWLVHLTYLGNIIVMCCRIGSVDGKLVCCGATIHIGILPFGWFCTALGKLCSPLYHSCQPWVTNHHIILKWLTSLENMFYSWEKCFLNVYKLLVLEFRLSPLLSIWAHYIGKGSIGI